MKEKEQKGITIIVLTITIIVLLIVSGVTISMFVNSTIVDDAENLVQKTEEYKSKDKQMRNEARDIVNGHKPDNEYYDPYYGSYYGLY